MTAKEILLDYYGKNDSRAHDVDTVELMQLYAKSKLEEAAERAMVGESDGEKVYDIQKSIAILQDRDYVYFAVNKESIINTPLD